SDKCYPLAWIFDHRVSHASRTRRQILELRHYLHWLTIEACANLNPSLLVRRGVDPQSHRVTLSEDIRAAYSQEPLLGPELGRETGGRKKALHRSRRKLTVVLDNGRKTIKRLDKVFLLFLRDPSPQPARRQLLLRSARNLRLLQRSIAVVSHKGEPNIFCIAAFSNFGARLPRVLPKRLGILSLSLQCLLYRGKLRFRLRRKRDCLACHEGDRNSNYYSHNS